MFTQVDLLEALSSMLYEIKFNWEIFYTISDLTEDFFKKCKVPLDWFYIVIPRLIVENNVLFIKLFTFFQLRLFTLNQSINLVFFLYYLSVHSFYKFYIQIYQRYGSTCTSFVTLSLGKLPVCKPCHVLFGRFCSEDFIFTWHVGCNF